MPKTSTERSRDCRLRKRGLAPPLVKRHPKTSLQRARECRARKKALKAQGVTNNMDLKATREYSTLNRSLITDFPLTEDTVFVKEEIDLSLVKSEPPDFYTDIVKTEQNSDNKSSSAELDFEFVDCGSTTDLLTKLQNHDTVKSELFENETIHVRLIKNNDTKKEEIEVVKEETSEVLVEDEISISDKEMEREGLPDALINVGNTELIQNAECKSMSVKEDLLYYEECQRSCTVCNKSFSKEVALLQHIETHLDERLFYCDVCHKSFFPKTKLYEHKRIHMARRFVCSVCNSSFTQKFILARHILSHSGIKPFSCNICNKSFTQRSSLVSHSICHTGEKPFTCNVCGNSFTRKTNLLRHQQNHFKE